MLHKDIKQEKLQINNTQQDDLYTHFPLFL